jgi:hypothetical protein
MIVHDLDLNGTIHRPDEAYSELVIDPDGMLSPAITHQGFETIAGRRSQII